VNLLKFLGFGKQEAPPEPILPEGVARCMFHVAPSAHWFQQDNYLHLCGMHMRTATRRNARLVPFPTHECALVCQECLSELLDSR